MKKILSIVLILTLVVSNTFIFADSNLRFSVDDHDVRLVKNRTYEFNGAIYGKLVYEIDGELFAYDINSENGVRTVTMSSKNEIIEKTTYNKKTGAVLTIDKSVLATFDVDLEKNKSKMRSTIYSETPIYGTSSDYNKLISIKYDSVRFSEKVIAAVQSGVFGYAIGLILAALISNPFIGIICGSIASTIFAYLTYNPSDITYFKSYKYGQSIPKYYKFIQRFYWDPDYTLYCDTNIYYSSEW